MKNCDITILLLFSYDIQALSIQLMSTGGKNNDLYKVVTSSSQYVLKRLSSPSYADENAITYEISVLTHLTNSTTFDVPLPIKTQTGDYTIADQHHTYVLLPFYAGSTLDMNVPNHNEMLAKVYGEMHTALASLKLEKRAGESPFNDFFSFAQSQVNIFALKPNDLGLVINTETIALTEWWNIEAQSLACFLEDEYPKLPKHICHNDITLSNILQHDGVVTVLLDFEFATQTTRAFDIATGLRHLMRIWETPEPWDKIRHFFGIYNQWQVLSVEEIETLPDLLRLRSVISIIWWLGRAENIASVPALIGYYQTLVTWLDQNHQQLIDIIHSTTN